MKIAVTSTGPELADAVDPRFGRCKCFVIVESDNMRASPVENQFAGTGGAGIAVAQAMVGRKVEVVLTGNCGPNAFEVLNAAGIKVVTGVAGTTVREAVGAFKVGVLKPTPEPNVVRNSGRRGRRPSSSGRRGADGGVCRP